MIDSTAVADLVDAGFAELTTGPFGTQLHASEYTPSGIAVINVRNVGFGEVRNGSLEHVSAETADRLSRHKLKAGDIVFGRKGAVERHAFLREEQEGWLQGSDCIRLRFSGGPLLPRFVSYFLSTPRHRQWMINYCSHGATMASLNQDILRRIEIPVPPTQIQRQIVSVLAAYDELIEDNLRRIEILEEMAQAVYREWFVNFRFPGHEDVELVDSAPGSTAPGWETRSLFDVADVAFGYAFKSAQFSNEPVGEKVIRIRNIPKNESATYTDEQAEDRYRVVDGDILIGMDGDFHMCVWADGPAMLNQRVTRVRPRGLLPILFLFHSLRIPIAHFNATITGTTVAHLGKRHLETIELVVPSGDVLDAVSQILEPAQRIGLNLRRQNANLRATRDLLLPRLVSGEIDVSGLDIDTDWLVA